MCVTAFGLVSGKAPHNFRSYPTTRNIHSISKAASSCDLLASLSLNNMAFINTLVKTAVVSWAAAPIAAASPLARHATLASRDTAAQTDYDFIVVGGGVSGLTVANRLTEDPNGMAFNLPAHV